MHIFRVKIRFRYQYRINARFEKKKISESAPVPYSKNNKNGESTLVPYSKKTKIGESEPCASYDKDANSAISRCRFQALAGPVALPHRRRETIGRLQARKRETRSPDRK